jgi:hypothetical protein
MIYKYQTAVQQIANEGEKSWEVDRISTDPFPAMYLKGAPFPIRGIPTAEGLFAMNVVKRLTVESMRFVIPWNVKRTLKWFTEVSFKACSNAILKEDKRMPITSELCRVLNIFSKELGYEDIRFGEVVSHIFEYDSAYRARIQDLADEMSPYNLKKNPIGEINKLVCTMCEREIQHKQLAAKYAIIARALRVLMFHPRIRKAFKRAVSELDRDKLRMDAGDRYWTYQRTDYQVAGLTITARLDLLKSKGYYIPEGKDIKK